MGYRNALDQWDVRSMIHFPPFIFLILYFLGLPAHTGLMIYTNFSIFWQLNCKIMLVRAILFP